MNSKFIISIVIFSFISLGCLAQGRILTSLEANPSARNAGMGNVMLGNTDEMYLYVNPAAFVFSKRRVGADFSTEIYPDSEVGRLMQYNFSGGYKFHPSRAVLAGVRYQGGLKVPYSDSKTHDGRLHPYEWTADIGYAFAVTPEIVVYGSGSYANSCVGNKAHGLTLSVGVGYQKELTVGSNPSLLTLGARLLDAGKSIKYNDTGLPYDLPTSVAVGGDWGITIANRHRFTYALSGRAFTPKNAKELHIGTGAEYTFNKMFSARVGYQYADKAADRLTMGLGANYANIRLNVAYDHTFSLYGVNTFMLGVGFGI